MIDVIGSIVGRIGAIEGFEGRVYRRWPKTKAKTPSCIVSRVSGHPTLIDEDGQEVIATLVYSVDVNADDPDQADALAEQVIDALGGMNFTRTGDTDFYDGEMRASRRVLTFIGTVDTRGQPFTN